MRWAGKKILLAGMILLPVIVTAVMMGLVVFPILKLALHLDFSQEYRKVESVEKIRFWDSRSGKVYGRDFWGLRPVGRREDDLPEEKPSFSWLDTDVYDMTASGDLAAWYDWKENTVFVGNVKGVIQETYEAAYTGEKLVFSPDERYLLFYEIAYGGGYTDDETCYYRVIDRENGVQYTIYAGHKEWYQVYWE